MKFNDTQKAFALTLVVYVAAALGVFAWFLFKTPAPAPQTLSKPIDISLNMFQSEPQEVVEEIIEEVVEEVIEEVEEVIEEIVEEPISEPEPQPKPEPIKKPEPKKQPVKKPVEKPIEKPVEQPKPAPQPEAAPAETAPSTEEIIRKPEFEAKQIANAEDIYLSELSAALAKHAQSTYPRMAQRRRIQGQVLIEFTILKTGEIIDIRLLQSSGNKMLDDASLSIFSQKMLNKFKPFPPEISRSSWQQKVPIEYQVR